jgi:hypothetical protein
MTEALLPKPVLGLMTPEAVTPAALFLVSDDAPRRTILNATAGGFRARCCTTEGVYLNENERTPERIAALFGQISDEAGQHLYRDGGGQVMKFITKAAKAHGVSLAVMPTAGLHLPVGLADHRCRGCGPTACHCGPPARIFTDLALEGGRLKVLQEFLHIDRLAGHNDQPDDVAALPFGGLKDEGLVDVGRQAGVDFGRHAGPECGGDRDMRPPSLTSPPFFAGMVPWATFHWPARIGGMTSHSRSAILTSRKRRSRIMRATMSAGAVVIRLWRAFAAWLGLALGAFCFLSDVFLTAFAGCCVAWGDHAAAGTWQSSPPMELRLLTRRGASRTRRV